MTADPLDAYAHQCEEHNQREFARQAWGDPDAGGYIDTSTSKCRECGKVERVYGLPSLYCSCGGWMDKAGR